MIEESCPETPTITIHDDKDISPKSGLTPLGGQRSTCLALVASKGREISKKRKNFDDKRSAAPTELEDKKGKKVVREEKYVSSKEEHVPDSLWET